MRARTGEESGFTLPELLVSISVLGIIVVPLAVATALFFRTSNQPASIYGSSGNARVIGTFLRSDGQAAQRIDTGAPCGTAATTVANFSWRDTASRDNEVSYVLELVDGSSDRRLVRRSCTDGSVVGTVRLVDSLGPSNVPTLTCDPDCVAPDRLTLAVTDGSNYRYRVTVGMRVNSP